MQLTAVQHKRLHAYAHITRNPLPLLPKVEILIGERVVVILKHVVVFHGLLDTRLVGGYALWHSLEVIPLFCEVLNGIGSLTKFV